MQTSIVGSDHAAKFSIPFPVTLTAVAGSWAFALALSAAIVASPPVEPPWLVAVALLYVVTGLSCAGLAHAIGTRRTFSGCALYLQACDLRVDQQAGFTIIDPHRRLRSAREIEITLAWREIATRVGGRKTYTEGPYALGSSVRWEHRESLPTTGGPGISGSFLVAGSEIKLQRLVEWRQRIEVLVRLRLGRWRSCVFVLPLDGIP